MKGAREIMMTGEVYYRDYLQLDKLLSCQPEGVEGAEHPLRDEHLFIVVHQVHELWFKQLLVELEKLLSIFVKERMDEREIASAAASMRRITTIQRVLVQQVDVLETMTPLDFLEFRDRLRPASGLQSVQFRKLEILLGIRPDDRQTVGGKRYIDVFHESDRRELERIETRPTLFDGVNAWLERMPFLRLDGYYFVDEYEAAVRRYLGRGAGEGLDQFDVLFDRDAFAGQGFRLSWKAFWAALFIHVYRDEPIQHLPFQVLTLLQDIDEGFTHWRYRHILLVARMIGDRPGTGGSEGRRYLERNAAESRVFRDLLSLSTFQVPRSALPELPDRVQEAMDSWLSSRWRARVP